MPAPDIRYVIDSAAECGDIALDTHTYIAMLCDTPNALIDDYVDPPELLEAKDWRGLNVALGQHLERTYEEWRETASLDDRAFCTVGALDELGHMVDTAADSIAWRLSERNETDVSAIRAFTAQSTMMKFVERLDQDISLSKKSFTIMLNEVETRRLRWREERDRVLDDILRDIEFGGKPPAYTRENRSIIKRSYKFLSRLIGAEKTRVYINGGTIRFKGKKAIFELSKRSHLTNSHGGSSALSMFDINHPDMHLGTICIYTPDVPLLDHVASLIMHIQAGEEDEILRQGNIYATEYFKTLDWYEDVCPPKPQLTINSFAIAKEFAVPVVNEELRQEVKMEIVRYIPRELNRYMWNNTGHALIAQL